MTWWEVVKEKKYDEEERSKVGWNLGIKSQILWPWREVMKEKKYDGEERSKVGWV